MGIGSYPKTESHGKTLVPFTELIRNEVATVFSDVVVVVNNFIEGPNQTFDVLLWLGF